MSTTSTCPHCGKALPAKRGFFAGFGTTMGREFARILVGLIIFLLMVATVTAVIAMVSSGAYIRR